MTTRAGNKGVAVWVCVALLVGGTGGAVLWRCHQLTARADALTHLAGAQVELFTAIERAARARGDGEAAGLSPQTLDPLSEATDDARRLDTVPPQGLPTGDVRRLREEIEDAAEGLRRLTLDVDGKSADAHVRTVVGALADALDAYVPVAARFYDDLATAEDWLGRDGWDESERAALARTVSTVVRRVDGVEITSSGQERAELAAAARALVDAPAARRGELADRWGAWLSERWLTVAMVDAARSVLAVADRELTDALAVVREPARPAVGRRRSSRRSGQADSPGRELHRGGARKTPCTPRTPRATIARGAGDDVGGA